MTVMSMKPILTEKMIIERVRVKLAELNEKYALHPDAVLELEVLEKSADLPETDTFDETYSGLVYNCGTRKMYISLEQVRIYMQKSKILPEFYTIHEFGHHLCERFFGPNILIDRFYQKIKHMITMENKDEAMTGVYDFEEFFANDFAMFENLKLYREWERLAHSTEIGQARSKGKSLWLKYCRFWKVGPIKLRKEAKQIKINKAIRRLLDLDKSAYTEYIK